MIKERESWETFCKSRLLWWVNRSLHLFGWAIIVVRDEKGEIFEVYPARVNIRGFSREDEESGFLILSEYLRENASELAEEIK